MLTQAVYICGRHDLFRVACVRYEHQLPAYRVVGLGLSEDLVVLEYVATDEFENVSSEVKKRFNANFPVNATGLYKGNPWDMRAMLRSILHGELVGIECRLPRNCFAYVYLVGMKGFDGPMFKIGMTENRDLSLARLEAYPDREILYVGQVPAAYVRRIEAHLKQVFTVNFTLMKGREYFSGEPTNMLKLIHEVMNKISNIEEDPVNISPPGFCLAPSRDDEYVPWDHTMISTLRNALHSWLIARQSDHMIVIGEYEIIEELQKYGLECGEKSTFRWKQFCRDYMVYNFEDRGLKWPLQINRGEYREESGCSVCKILSCYQLEPAVILDVLKRWVT